MNGSSASEQGRRGTIPIPRRTPRPAGVSDAVRRAAATLGVILDDLREPPSPAPLHLDITPGAVTLITGHSGSGKTSLLHDIGRALRAHDWRLLRPSTRPLPHRPCIDLFPGTAPERAMRLLAGAGLGDARCFIRPPGTLSLGEQVRLRLARTLHRAEGVASTGRRVVVILDEFGTGLDAMTARSVAALLHRFATRHPRLVFVVASTRDDLYADLRPDDHIHLGPVMPARPRRALLDDITIDLGTRSDYLALAAHHYRPGMPATIARTLIAWHGATGTLAGVLTVSMPTRNGAWRRGAWPDLHGGRGLGALNDEVRTISRVIVEPRFRGLGLARRLVGAYLDDPLTSRTEALAAMGRACPFFEHAGMRPVARPPSVRHERLRAVLDDAGLTPWRLVDLREARRRLCRSPRRALLEDELRRWANASGATRRLLAAPPESILRAAVPALTAVPLAYVHDRRVHEAAA